MLQLAELLYKNYDIPYDVAHSICSLFLKKFRNCPDKPSVNIDEWRHLLWAQALDDKYSHLSKEIYLEWLKLRYHYLSLAPDIKSLLVQLKQHYLLGLITNGPSRAQWEKVQRLDLQSYFDIILVSGDLPWEKPNCKIFEQACQYLGVEARNCVMVGDKLETDIQGGIEAQLGYTIWIPLTEPNLDNNDPSPDFTLTCVTELLSLLPALNKISLLRSKSLKIRDRVVKHPSILSFPDLHDSSSNSSDGS